ncbi:hypothetical protein KQX54_004456 [Cotesia glomerata]|uniref:Uncharacterized protein n=1 Tax=Cotesia glomerata TaxID=32391 RepID=A0AAV7HHM3_COTGL|nr:hypothetical protein KQX54_004456 [Cotesia glomerata]
MRELCSVIQRSDVIGASHGASVDMESPHEKKCALGERKVGWWMLSTESFIREQMQMHMTTRGVRKLQQVGVLPVLAVERRICSYSTVVELRSKAADHEDIVATQFKLSAPLTSRDILSTHLNSDLTHAT